MTDAETPPGGGTKTYTIRDVGAGARIAQGEHISWNEATLASEPGGQELVRQFSALLQRIADAPDLDETTRSVATAKTQAVADGLAEAQQHPGKLHMALIDAKGVLSAFAGWAWTGLSDILKSEAAQKTIGTITEASTKAAIGGLIGSG